jgi:hypothetical protein
MRLEVRTGSWFGLYMVHRVGRVYMMFIQDTCVCSHQGSLDRSTSRVGRGHKFLAQIIGQG